MKILLLTLFIFFGCASRTSLKRPFYWTASKGDQTFYFLGTMHVGFELDDLPKRVRDDLDQSDVVRIEVTSKLGHQVSAEVFEKALKDFNEKGGHSPGLKEKFTTNSWERLSYTLNHDDVKKYLKQIGIHHPSTEIHPLAVLKVVSSFAEREQSYVFHPSLLRHTHYYEKHLFFDFQSILDREIESNAIKQDKNVESLDSHDELVKLIESNDPIINLLEGFLANNSEKSYRELEELKAVYISGDSNNLDAYISQQMFDSKTILRDRNKTWLGKLLLHNENKVFVAAGVAHFHGRTSLLKHFEETGFSVSRVEFPQK